mmetsp:Transcript_65652/g.112874  ORF Transcript_65652/g.112874 Transcript_65652/m.112874 type:complete len:244 (+) Transcript_65652:3-734(+)
MPTGARSMKVFTTPQQVIATQAATTTTTTTTERTVETAEAEKPALGKEELGAVPSSLISVVDTLAFRSALETWEKVRLDHAKAQAARVERAINAPTHVCCLKAGVGSRRHSAQGYTSGMLAVAAGKSFAGLTVGFVRDAAQIASAKRNAASKPTSLFGSGDGGGVAVGSGNRNNCGKSKGGRKEKNLSRAKNRGDDVSPAADAGVASCERSKEQAKYEDTEVYVGESPFYGFAQSPGETEFLI